MMGSRLHPNMYRGAEDSTAKLYRNKKPKSASSPDWLGNLYLPGAGWFWLSGWDRKSKFGDFVTVKPRPMTDADCDYYIGKQRPRDTPVQAPTDAQSQPKGNGQSDIPF